MSAKVPNPLPKSSESSWNLLFEGFNFKLNYDLKMPNMKTSIVVGQMVRPKYKTKIVAK